MKYNICVFILAATVVSLMGWIVENIWLALTKGYIDNRSMTLPFLLGYGLFIVALYLVIGTPQSLSLLMKGTDRTSQQRCILVYFLISMVLVSIGEVILGTLVERVCGFSYWNYEQIPLHITKYTSLPTSSGFALGITIFMEKFFLPLLDLLAKLPFRLSCILALVFGISLTADFWVSFVKMYRHRSLNYRWRLEVRKPRFSYRFRSN